MTLSRLWLNLEHNLEEPSLFDLYLALQPYFLPYFPPTQYYIKLSLSPITHYNIYFVILHKMFGMPCSPWLTILHFSKGTTLGGVDFITDTPRIVSVFSKHQVPGLFQRLHAALLSSMFISVFLTTVWTPTEQKGDSESLMLRIWVHNDSSV